jgi:hypothetical protein
MRGIDLLPAISGRIVNSRRAKRGWDDLHLEILRAHFPVVDESVRPNQPAR